jgi:hypothetical protein
VDLIHRFDLTRMGFSKFEGSMIEGDSPLGLDEFARGRIPS